MLVRELMRIYILVGTISCRHPLEPLLLCHR